MPSEDLLRNDIDPMTHPLSRSRPFVDLSKRTALRVGYGCVIALLLFSSIEAYRIQNTVSERHVGIYRHYVQQDAAAAQLRRTIWESGNFVRDFFINTGPQAAALLKSQLKDLEQQSQQAFAQLDRLPALRRTQPELAESLRDFWSLLDPVPDSMIQKSKGEQYQFLQKEIVPRRSALYNVLRELTETELSILQQSEADFAETRRTAARRLFLMLGLSVVLALLVSRFSLTYAESLERETDRQYEQVVRAKKEQEQLSSRLLEIEEDGKRKLSRELHDEIGQTLAVLQIEISGALSDIGDQSGDIKERLRRARDLAEKTVQTVRNIALLLRPALLDDLGLVPALQWQLEEFGRRSGIRCDFSEEGVEDLLPDAIKTCVFRVVQEALHNCEKHASASRISLMLRQTAQLLMVDIRDDGCGFEVDEKSKPRRNAGLGLLGMRERAVKVDGSLLLETASGRGTRLTLRIPLAAHTTAASALPLGVGATV